MPPGTLVLGRYIVLGKLAMGGMAEVYLARVKGTTGRQKLVVLKRIRPHLVSDSDFVAMFVNEARLAALIDHENVVAIFDLGQEDSNWYLAMEFLDGRDMVQIGRSCRDQKKAVPFGVTARIIADAAAGLDHAHKLRGSDGKPLNLVHRDMSPENILITFDGNVKLLDFGIAKARDNALRTQAGQIKGKLGYVAPEAIKGETLDGRADIFAMGSTLYLFLSGRPAFPGKTPMEVFEKSLRAPVPPRKANPTIPVELEAICLRCLAQKPKDRFQTAGELSDALNGFLNSAPVVTDSKQLGRFMEHLFPPGKDPLRTRLDRLVNANPPGRNPDPTIATSRPLPEAVPHSDSSEKTIALQIPSPGSPQAVSLPDELPLSAIEPQKEVSKPEPTVLDKRPLPEPSFDGPTVAALNSYKDKPQLPEDTSLEIDIDLDESEPGALPSPDSTRRNMPSLGVTVADNSAAGDVESIPAQAPKPLPAGLLQQTEAPVDDNVSAIASLFDDASSPNDAEDALDIAPPIGLSDEPGETTSTNTADARPNVVSPTQHADDTSQGATAAMDVSPRKRKRSFLARLFALGLGFTFGLLVVAVALYFLGELDVAQQVLDQRLHQF